MNLGQILVTGGSGFLGQNLVEELLRRGYHVRSLDQAETTADPNPRLQTMVGDICNPRVVADAVDGIDTVFHTAAVIDLLGGRAAAPEYRQRSFAVNVDATKTLVHQAQKAGCSRLVYTSSNSVVMGDRPIVNGDESLPYTTRFADLYTETKVAAERYVLDENGTKGLLTCAVRPSGIWGPGDQTMFRKIFEPVVAGRVRALIGNRHTRMDNSHVTNLMHGMILAAEHLEPTGPAPGQAYFITDGEPINVFEFARPLIEACGQHWPRIRLPGTPVRMAMTAWQWLHFRLGIPAPPLEPLVVTRLCVDNYYSIDKARRDLGYQPVLNTEQAMRASTPYYIGLFQSMQAAHTAQTHR